MDWAHAVVDGDEHELVGVGEGALRADAPAADLVVRLILGRAVGVGHERGHHELVAHADRSEEHTSELQSLMRISYAVFCLKKKIQHTQYTKPLLKNQTNREQHIQ